MRRLHKLIWIGKLAAGKMREGPRPWLRAVRRGLFDALPTSVKASLARRRYRLPEVRQRRLALTGHVAEGPGQVSVILPVFNQCEFLAESIDSVLAQTYDNLELIVLDDGSTDAINDVLQRYAGDPRVRILTQPNLKLPAALSNAFRFARGEFRTWTSADNVMEPDQLACLVGYLREHPTTAMVYADYIVIGPDGAPLHGSDFRPQNRASPESSEVRLPRSTETLNVLQDNFIGACFLYRGWVGRCIGPYSSKLGIEDYDYWMRINGEFGIEHLGTDQLLYRYRWHDKSLNAQAKELRLFETGEELIRHERERAAWRAESWEVFETLPTGPSDLKRICLLRPENLEPESLDSLPERVVIALEWESPALVYRWADRLRDPRLVHFATKPGVVQALALFTDEVFEIPPGEERMALALSRGNELVCSWRTGAGEAPQLPRVWSPDQRRCRVLLQTVDFDQGGLECVVLDLAATLAGRGFELRLLVLGKRGPLIERAREQGLEILDLDDASESGYAALLEEHDIGLVFAHHSLFGAGIAREHGTPFVQTLHNTYHWFYPDEIEAWRRADAATTAYIHVSANVAMYAHEKLGLSAEKSIIVENGVQLPAASDTKRRTDMRKSFDLNDDDYVLLNVASIYPPKSQVPIAQALAAARREDKRLRVVVLGRTMNERYAGQLESLIREHELEGSLILAGYHSDPEPFYEMADAFLLPSYWEGCSLAIAEALVRDLPCVLSDVGAARRQLRPGEGVIVDAPFAPVQDLGFGNLPEALAAPRAGFVDELAAAMLETARRTDRLPPDPARRERFDIEAVAERYARILAWIQHGGGPAQARPFAWASFREGELR